MFWKSRQFKVEQDYWYGILEASGFKDIEKEEHLRQHAENCYWQAPSLERDSKLEYFTLLDQYIREKAPEFDDSIDYFVMHKFARGLKNAEICRQLESLGNKRNRHTVTYIRRKYENRWGIRKWSPDQMRSQVKKKA